MFCRSPIEGSKPARISYVSVDFDIVLLSIAGPTGSDREREIECYRIDPGEMSTLTVRLTQREAPVGTSIGSSEPTKVKLIRLPAF